VVRRSVAELSCEIDVRGGAVRREAGREAEGEGAVEAGRVSGRRNVILM